MVEEPQGQGGLDGEIRVPPLPAPPAAPAGRPGSDCLRGQPHRHIATSNEGFVVGRPVPNAILRLIRGMNLRLHPRSVDPAEGLEKCGPRRPTRSGYSCNNAARRAGRRSTWRGAGGRADAVDDEMHAGTRGGATQREIETLVAPGTRGVIGRGQVETQHLEDRRQEAFSLPQGQVEDEPERQRGFGGEIGIRQLPATAPAPRTPAGRRQGENFDSAHTSLPPPFFASDALTRSANIGRL